MKKNRSKISISNRYDKFRRGFIGIGHLIEFEPNAWFDIAAAILVIIGGIEYNLSAMEWIVVVIAIAFVLATMAINLAIEFLSELPETAKSPFSDMITKLSASAVLIANISAFVIGLIVFIPKIFLV